MRKLVFILALLLYGNAIYAQNYQLHSVYIYSFIRYIQWPETKTSEKFVIGVMGDSPLMSHLQGMAETKKAGARDIIIRRFESAKDVSGCNILFISKELGAQLPELIKRVGKTGTLLITEEEGLAHQGSNINFVTRSGKLTFELNKAAMERAALKVSSELARLAIII